MQETRQHILEILREANQATVDEIVDELRQRRSDKITAVTVRHHLNILQKSGLITLPKLLHRSSPGRPQHVYELTDNAQEHFPNNYQKLAQGLLQCICNQTPANGVNVILEGVADAMAQDANIEACPLEDRLEKVVSYLNEHGYNAEWDETDQGFVLSTHNCPYHEIAQGNNHLCEMDMRLISSMLGVVPRLLSRVSDGQATCSYLIPEHSSS